MLIHALDADKPSVVASGGVRATLRLEGLLGVVVASAVYLHLGGSALMFAVLFLAPDISLLGYLAGPRVGALSYNALHSTAGPLVLATAGLAAPGLLPFALIWLAHIGLDRALGYGLKYAAGFRLTHLGRLGR